MEILLDGRDQKFYTKCVTCGSELQYDYYDVHTDDQEGHKLRYIKCPVCGERLIAFMMTQAEYYIAAYAHKPTFAACPNW